MKYIIEIKLKGMDGTFLIAKTDELNHPMLVQKEENTSLFNYDKNYFMTYDQAVKTYEYLKSHNLNEGYDMIKIKQAYCHTQDVPIKILEDPNYTDNSLFIYKNYVITAKRIKKHGEPLKNNEFYYFSTHMKNSFTKQHNYVGMTKSIHASDSYNRVDKAIESFERNKKYLKYPSDYEDWCIRKINFSNIQTLNPIYQ